MLNVGERAPDFELPDQNGRRVQLRALLAQGPVLLYFYPADFTPVCTREACAFRELHGELAHSGATLVGISPQDSASHARFRDRHRLSFPLLSDPEKRVIRAYGCDGLLGFGVKRVTFLIATDGRIAERVHSALRVGAHRAVAERFLENNPGK